MIRQRAVDPHLTPSRRRDPLRWALDALYAPGPGPEATRRALERLRRALDQQVPSRLYYDRLRHTPLGDLFLAVSEKGVVAVEFAASESSFLRRLHARTGARPIHSPDRTVEAIRQLREYLAGRRSQFDLALDLTRVPSFQQQVLLAAAEVPRGQVTTYNALALRLGRPGAARAVGQALARNPIPIILPCHRVLASDGSLGGYSAPHGVSTKARLLALEGARLRATP